MSSILENLIRTYLIEGRTVAKLRGVSAKETAKARAAGAVHAYAVLVKGTSTPTTIIDLVTGASLASAGADTENRIAVGRSSKFADGNYDYVMSDPLPKKRQIIVVRIFKAIDKFGGQSGRQPSIGTSFQVDGEVGASPLFTASHYKELLKSLKQDTKAVDDLKSKDSEASDAIKQATDVLAGNKEVTDYELTRDGKVVGTFNGTIDKNGKPFEGKAVLTDGQIFDGTFKDGAFVSGTCKKILSSGNIFEGELTDGVPTANVIHNIIKPDGKYYEGTVDTNFKHVDGTVYTTSAKTEKVGDFILGAWSGVETPLFTNQQIIDATKSSKYSDASKYFQQLMVDKIATQPKIVTSAGELYTKVKNNIYGRWGNDSKNLTKFMLAIFELDQNSGVTDQFIKRINGLNKEIIESILHIKTAVLEQINLDAGIKAKEQILATTPTPTPKPTPTPSPKPIPTPKPQPTPQKDSISKDVYILKKNHDISYIDGSANSFLQNMKKWVTGSHRSIGQAATTIFQDSKRGKWFTRKSITIPKGTKVYIHPDKVVMLVNDPQGTPDGNTWRIIYQFGTKTLSTSSYANLWKSLWKTYIAYPRFQDLADSLDIDNIVYSTPKYRNDELVGFLRTLDPKVQSKQELVKNLSKKQKEQLNKQFDMCIQIAKDFYEIFGKNPETYFGKYKGSWLIPGDQDLKGALIYLQDAVKDAYIKEFKLLSTSTNKDIRDNAKKLHDVYVSVQEYLRDLIRSGSSQRDMLFKFKLIHPFDSKKNTNVTIRFDYL
jgi:hypothetical protein